MTSDVKKGRHFPALDGVRGLAVLIIVLYHTAGGAQSPHLALRVVGNILKAGWSGVTLFFLLSGFLITGILWDSKGAAHWWRNFYMRRVLRIAPLYYGALLLVLLVAWASHNFRAGSAGVWIFALYLQNLPWIRDAGLRSRPLGLGHFWSLAVEEQFYLVWPLLLSRLRTTSQAKYLCLGTFLASTAFRYGIWAFSIRPIDYNGFILSRAGELALGGYLALCFRDGSWSRLERFAPWMAAASLAGFVAVGFAKGGIELTLRSVATTGLLLISLFYAAFIVLAMKNGLTHRAMNAAWLRWLGGISYGIYIFHGMLVGFYGWIGSQLVPHAGRVQGIAVRGVITWILSTLIAWLSFRYFEHPILRMRKYFQSNPAKQQAMAAKEC